jgi:hypothetical protein
MFINRPEVTATAEEREANKIIPGAAELIIAKHRGGELARISLKFIGECTKFVDVDEQNRDEEPPQYGTTPARYDDEDDEEYVAPEDEYIPPEPPMRKGDLKMAEDDFIPFE